MEIITTVTTKPTTLTFSSTTRRPYFPKKLSFKTFKQHRFSTIPFCLRNPKTPQKPNFDSLNPLPIFQSIKDLNFTQAHKWISCIQSNTNGEYFQSKGLGVAFLSITSNAKVRISPFVATLAGNPTFVSGLCAWFFAQSMKVVLNFFVERKWDLRMFFASGGMPSSHSALCTALTTSVALCHGVADSLFPVCLGFSLIVMYDATGVRRHAGMQAEVLNMIVEDLFQGHPISQRKLKELLGHTPLQVIAGALLGIVVAYICCRGRMVAL